MEPQRLLLLVLVVSAFTANAAAAAVQPRDSIEICKQLMAWAGYQFPPKGTLFCPNDHAYEKWARQSGFETFALLWAAVERNPEAWWEYIARLLSYMHSETPVAAANITAQGVALQTRYNAASNASAGGVSYASITLSATGRKDQKLEVHLAADAASSSERNMRDRRTRMRITQADVINSAEGVVHAVSEVPMPPDSYPSIKKAFQKNKGLKRMKRYLRRSLRELYKTGDALKTIIAPIDAAWGPLEAITKKGAAPGAAPWLGQITTTNVRKQRDLQAAIMRYLIIDVKSLGLTQALTWEDMKAAAVAAGRTGKPGFIGVASSLTAGGAAQTMRFTYAPSTGGVYLVGSRNELYSPYMAASLVQTTTIRAGLATIITVEGNVPLPRKTGIAAFDSPSAR
ncbi:hypothetical protein Rsub_00494 [Raphidocelis subcapitata]|uniref:FAS1 domain-containing protein n=1 Tax=Raphidocelis subcapitata TaxID=307507 RepID=A0A2V0NQG7_9CHLO|nr:hypothetical protein Rsub_00494 [Raphidocelis subcapitata]|eukprot:GBF87783.1 hypothetical protein Rsub_00494 [Raphidocelis subcapitata]